MTKIPSRIRLTTLLVCAGFAGCGGGTTTPTTPPIVIDGSSTVFRISRVTQEAYGDVDPSAIVVVDNHGTGGGFGRYLQGEVDIVDASRDAKPDEAARAKAQGIEWTRFLVGYDGITLVVNPKNDVCQVAHGRSTQGDLGSREQGQDLEGRRSHLAGPEDRPLFPDNDSGTFEFFTEAIVGKEPAASARTCRPAPTTTSWSTEWRATPTASDTSATPTSRPTKTNFAPSPIQNGPDAKPIAPTPETILDKSYAPLSRPLYIFVKNSASGDGPKSPAFVKYYLENVGTLAPKGGIRRARRPRTSAANAKALATWW